METAKPLPLLAFAPVCVTALLPLLWTLYASPYTKYGDSWAIDPALIALPLVVGLRLLCAYKSRWRIGSIAYGILHCAIFFCVWLWCLTTKHVVEREEGVTASIVPSSAAIFFSSDSHRRFRWHRRRHAIVISIPANAEKRSRSRWNPCSRSPGIGVHVRPE